QSSITDRDVQSTLGQHLGKLPLRGISKSSVQACPAVNADLRSHLARLEQALDGDITPKMVKSNESQVEQQLADWGARTSEYFKAKANEVKELLIVLAR